MAASTLWQLDPEADAGVEAEAEDAFVVELPHALDTNATTAAPAAVATWVRRTVIRRGWNRLNRGSFSGS